MRLNLPRRGRADDEKRDQDDAVGLEAAPAAPTAASRDFRDTFLALGVRNFRLFWLGQLISVSGTWMQTIGQAWLILSLTSSAFAVGTVTTLQYLPITFLVLFGGVFADRVPKRGFLVGTQSAAMLQALILGLLVSTGAVRVWHVYLLALALGVTNAFDNPTRQAFVPEMVGRDLVTNAVALNSTLFNAARIVGPAVGGVTIATIGIDGTFYLNAASFIPVIIALLMMRPADLFPVTKGEGKLFQQLREGVSFAYRTPQVLLILIVLFFIGTFGYNFSTALPLLAKFVLNVGSVGFGVMTAVLGVGALLAALTIAYLRRAGETQILLGGGVFSVLLILVGLSRWFAVTLPLLVLLGFAGIVFTASANTRLQLLSPGYLRGRIMSLYVLLFAGTTPIGAFLLGNAAERIGIQRSVVLFGIISAVGVVVGMFYRAGHLSRTRSDNSAPPPAASTSGGSNNPA
jgi:MFS family permease